MRNSLVITVGATLITILSSTLAGYVYSRYRSRFLTGTAFFMLFMRMLPPIIITLPLFPVANLLRMNDTHLILILLYSTFFVSLSTWIMKAFMDALPKELEESAVIDGATLWQTIVRVVMPLAIHGIIACVDLRLCLFLERVHLCACIHHTQRQDGPPGHQRDPGHRGRCAVGSALCRGDPPGRAHRALRGFRPALRGRRAHCRSGQGLSARGGTGSSAASRQRCHPRCWAPSQRAAASTKNRAIAWMHRRHVAR